jgi:multiple sugar transport system permease protein
VTSDATSALRHVRLLRRSSGIGGAPTQSHRDVLLLLAPCVVYLVAFSIFPLCYSLAISFMDYDSRADEFSWIGIGNYKELFGNDIFWQAVKNTLVFTFGGVAIQVVLGTALALFFNQRLRGAWIARGILILPMLITPVVVGVMWRALLNPEWGMANWLAERAGLENVGWLSNPKVALLTLLLVDTWQWTPFVFVVVYARLQALPQDVFEAGEIDGTTFFQKLRHLTLPLLAPAIVFAAVFRAIDAFRTFDLVFGLTNGGPGQSTTTLSFQAFRNSFGGFFRYGYASAIAYVMVIAAAIGMTLLFKFVRIRRAAY